MNIREHYKKLESVPTPKQAFLREVAEVAMVSDATVLAWISGDRNPSNARLKLLSDHYNCDPDELGIGARSNKTNKEEGL